MDFDPNLPIYLQIIEFLKTDIVIGKLNPGDKLPSVRGLSESYHVNMNTVMRAYEELERQGITYTQRGMGTFVSKDTDIMLQLKKELSEKFVTDFLNGMRSLQFSSQEIIDVIKKEIMS